MKQPGEITFPKTAFYSSKFKKADGILKQIQEASKYTPEQLADKWIRELQAEGLSPKQMLEVFALAKEKYEYLKSKK